MSLLNLFFRFISGTVHYLSETGGGGGLGDFRGGPEILATKKGGVLE